MRGLAKQLRASATAFGEVFRNPNLRWLQLAWTTSILAHYAFLIAVSVYAYEAGGEAAVGLLFLVRLVPAALISPFAGLLGDRYRRERVLLFTNLVRIVLIGAATVGVFLDAPHTTIYALSVAATIATTPYRSAEAALTPSLARSPTELTAANAVASSVEAVAFFVGPALAGFLLAVASTGAVFFLTTLVLVASAIFITLIDVEQRDRPQGEIETPTILSEAFAGFRTIVRHPSLRFMMGLLTAQTAVCGAVQVYIVVAAIELLDLGTSGVGYLNSAMGVGSLVGSAGALSLTGARRLSAPFMLGAAFMGLAVLGVGLWPEIAVALMMFGLFGLSSSVLDVAGLTIIQRAVPDEVLARVFGVIQMLWFGSLGIGAALAPALIAWLGLESALIVTGASLPVLVALSWTRVAHIDADAKAPQADELRLLGRTPIFAPLPGTTLEHLTARLIPLQIEPGTVIVAEGDAGDRFYLVAEGELEVTAGGEHLSALEAGDYFGEIALLRDLPRTATVIARTPVVVYALEREDFLAAVTGHPPSAEAAETVVSARLAGVASTGGRPNTA